MIRRLFQVSETKKSPINILAKSETMRAEGTSATIFISLNALGLSEVEPLNLLLRDRMMQRFYEFLKKLYKSFSILFTFKLIETFRMATRRTLFRRFFTKMNISTFSANPPDLFLFFKYCSRLYFF